MIVIDDKMSEGSSQEMKSKVLVIPEVDSLQKMMSSLGLSE